MFLKFYIDYIWLKLTFPTGSMEDLVRFPSDSSCSFNNRFLWMSSLLSRSEIGRSESSTGIGETLGFDTVVNSDPVDLASDKPRGEHAAKLTADLLSFIRPFLL